MIISKLLYRQNFGCDTSKWHPGKYSVDSCVRGSDIDRRDDDVIPTLHDVILTSTNVTTAPYDVISAPYHYVIPAKAGIHAAWIPILLYLARLCSLIIPRTYIFVCTLSICSIFVLPGAFAGYGDSCAPLPFAPDNFIEETTYGQARRAINGIGWSGEGQYEQYCDPNEASIWFAARRAPGEVSTLIKIPENESRMVSTIVPGNPDLGGNPFLQNVALTAKRHGSLLCLFMPTARGFLPLICKNSSAPPPPPEPEEECSNVGKMCYTGTTRSQSLFNFSGLAVDCLKETLDKVFYRKKNCIPQDEDVAFSALNAFPAFQETLKNTIGMALILYTMFFGANMVLNKEYAHTDKIAIFFLKFVLVLYFAVGLGPISFQAGKPEQENGMTKYGLPLLTSMAPEFARMIFDAGGSRGLCQFNTARYKAGHEFYALWDAIDCRIGYYLGMDLLYNMNSSILSQMTYVGSSGGGGEALPDFGRPGRGVPDALNKVGSFKFFTVLFGFFTAGNIIVVASGLMFCVIFLSIMLYFITHYLVCMVTLYVMAYISPIFIPMALFTRTKAYFDAWLKICLSCALQPAVVAGFIAILVTMYDSAIFKDCEFKRHDYTKGEINISTFEVQTPNGAGQECRNSAGYKLLQYYSGVGWDRFFVILFEIKSITNDIFSLLTDLLYVLVFSMIFYYFSKSIGQFAADITSGPIMDAVTASPTKIVDLAKQAAAFLKDAAATSQGKPPGMDSTPPDAFRKGGSDNVSSGGGEGSDFVGSGGGDGSDSVSGGGGK